MRAFARHWHGGGDPADVLRRHDAGEDRPDGDLAARLETARRAVYAPGADEDARSRLDAVRAEADAWRRAVDTAIAAASAESGREHLAPDADAGPGAPPGREAAVRGRGRIIRLTPLVLVAAVLAAAVVFLGGLATGTQVRAGSPAVTLSPSPDPRLRLAAVFSRPMTREDRPDADVGTYLQISTFRLLSANSTASVSLYAARSTDHLVCLVAVGADARVLGTCVPQTLFAKAPLRLDFNVTHDPTDDSGSDRRLEVVASWSADGQVTLIVPGTVVGGN